jgi:hypothetical protein
VLKGLNQILGNFNITKQFTDSRGDIAYLLADVSDVSLDQIRDIYSEISEMPTNIKTRLLCEFGVWASGPCSGRRRVTEASSLLQTRSVQTLTRDHARSLPRSLQYNLYHS